MKVYIIQWGYNSTDGGGPELDSIWTHKESARKHLHNEASGDHLRKENENYWTNGDKWMTMCEVNVDNPDLYGDPDEDR